MNNRWKSISTLAALTFFAVFAVCILTVLLGGGKIYRKLNERDNQSYDSRTCAQYLTSRVRQAEGPDAVSIVVRDGVEMLQITMQFDLETYVTGVYCYDGWLRELFTSADSDLLPEAGEKILPLQNLTFSLDRELLAIEYTDTGGRAQTLYLHIRGREEGYNAQ